MLAKQIMLVRGMLSNDEIVNIFFFLIAILCSSNLEASTKKNIIKNFIETKNLSFKFKQNIEDKTQEGNCIIEYPKKIYCTYNESKKILVSNGKKLVIQNLNNDQYYIYPIERTAFNLILDKDFLLEKIKFSKGDIVDNKYLRFKFIEGDNQINIFFDINSYNIIGWQNVDIYQNLVITYLFNLEKNIQIKKNQFRLPVPTNN